MLNNKNKRSARNRNDFDYGKPIDMDFKQHKLLNKLTKDNADKDARMLRVGKNLGRSDSPDDDRLLMNVGLSP